MSEPTYLLDLSHTSHTRARTGIQRVSRALLAHLPQPTPITFDPYQGAWRRLKAWERSNLASSEPAKTRGAKWPLGARLRGRLRAFGSKPAAILGADLLIVPELFSPAVARAYPSLFTQIRGARVALFHDAIALQLPAAAPAKTVARFPSYLKELLAFDGIAAISEASRDSLLGYWRWLGIKDVPPVQAIPLGTDLGAGPRPPAPRQAVPEILYVSSLEARKNHVALLDACESLWATGAQFRLRLIGLAHPTSGKAALERVAQLKAAGRPLIYDGAVTEAALEAAYGACTFTVYPSVLEGFGLPVIESLARGRPCICSGLGAVGEAARGGGCLTVADPQPAALAAAIRSLLTDPTAVAALAAEAVLRTTKTWTQYAREVALWSQTLRRRAN